MPRDNGWRMALREGMRRSAEHRKCEQCGRRAALVTRYEPGRVGYVCRWAYDSDGRLCSWPGVWRDC